MSPIIDPFNPEVNDFMNYFFIEVSIRFIYNRRENNYEL